MRTGILSAVAGSILLTVSAFAQSKPADASHKTCEQKIERTKVELKEIGRNVKEKAKVVGKAVGTEAEKAGEAIDRKVYERKAKRGTVRRGTV